MDRARVSPLSLHVGRGKTLFAVAIELGYERIPEIRYFGASTIEDARAALVGACLGLPKGSKVVGVAPAIGFWHDENGSKLVA